MNDVEIVKRELAWRIEELAATFSEWNIAKACIGASAALKANQARVIQNLHRWRKGWALGRLRGFGEAFPKPARFVDARAEV